MASKLRDVTDDIDYLIPLVTYLGSNPYWWARSSDELAKELSLDTSRVSEVFKKYETVFRKSEFDEAAGRHYYSLQMRYARRDDGRINEPPQVSALPVLSENEVISLIDHLFRISSIETTIEASRRSARVAIAAAIVSALAAIAAALVRISLG